MSNSELLAGGSRVSLGATRNLVLNGHGTSKSGILDTVALGQDAGQFNQNNFCVAIGADAGKSNQGGDAVAIGDGAGEISQGIGAIAIGSDAGTTGQGNLAIAIGQETGAINQGASSIGIGAGLGVGATSIHANCVVLSGLTYGGASNPLPTQQASSFYVAPVRQINPATVAGSKALYYDPNTKEIFYST